MSDEPHQWAVESARRVALLSPCEKSKRGVVIFDRRPIYIDGAPQIVSSGFNGQPRGFACSGSPSCRQHCAKLCLHAEQRAILAGVRARRNFGFGVTDLDLLHVKVVDGAVVPEGGPSCWQCSRLVVEVELRGRFSSRNAARVRYPGRMSIERDLIDDCSRCHGRGVVSMGTWSTACSCATGRHRARASDVWSPALPAALAALRSSSGKNRARR